MEVLQPTERLGAPDAADKPVRVILSARQCFALLSHFEESRHIDDLRDALTMHGEPDDDAATISSDDIVRELGAAPWRAEPRHSHTHVRSIESGGGVRVEGEIYFHPALDPWAGRLVRVVIESLPDVVVVTTLTRTEICRIPVAQDIG